MSGLTQRVVIFCRPGGSSSSTDMSRSPYKVSARVRGMGVADITSTCGRVSPRSLKTARWTTPNRCCSSTTARVSRGISTDFWIRAWVPMRMSTSPSRAFRCTSSFSFLPILPSRRPMVMGFCAGSMWARITPSSAGFRKGPSSLDTVRKCCSARISVGAIIAP